MYQKIDELVNEIKKDELYQNLVAAQKALYNDKTLALLSRYQQLQEDYNRFQKFDTHQELKKELQTVRQEMAKHPDIQKYYQCYYAFNDMLEKVTHIIFDGISDELVVGGLKI